MAGGEGSGIPLSLRSGHGTTGHKRMDEALARSLVEQLPSSPDCPPAPAWPAQELRAVQGPARASQGWNSVPPHGAHTSLFKTPPSRAWPPVPDRMHTVGPSGDGGVACPLGARLRNAGHPAHRPGAPRCPGRALLPTLLGHPASLPWTDWFGSPIQSPPSLSSGGDGLRPAQRALCLCHSGLSSETERPMVGV